MNKHSTEALKRLREAATHIIDFVVECNPQWPDFPEGEDCPPGHKYECGRCEALRELRAALAAFEVRS